MACVWCEGDSELHESLFNILKDYLNSTPDNLRRAVQDFYHCPDCINTYHRIKPNFIQSQNDSKVCFILSTYFNNGIADFVDLGAISEIRSQRKLGPGFFMSKKS